MDDDERLRLLELLRSQHDFPGPYTFKVIYRNQPATGDAIVAALTGVGVGAIIGEPNLRASSSARFVSMTLDMRMETAEGVLEVYAALKEMDSVLSYF